MQKNEEMKDISKLQEGQKIRIILTDDSMIEGTVRFTKEEEDFDYEWGCVSWFREQGIWLLRPTK